MDYTVESFGISDKGLIRDSNEDAFREISFGRFFALADGMGGHNAGEIAAKEAIHRTTAVICRNFSSLSEISPSRVLKEAISDANRWVHDLSERNAELSGMGTTLCCMLVYRDSLVYANVGDSRIYRFTDRLEQITEDHRISLPGKKNYITKALGTHPVIEPEIRSIPLTEKGIYFLCSDGLTDYVCDQTIETILENSSRCIKTAAGRLVDMAKKNGGGDNITVLIIKVLNAISDLPR